MKKVFNSSNKENLRRVILIPERTNLKMGKEKFLILFCPEDFEQQETSN